MKRLVVNCGPSLPAAVNQTVRTVAAATKDVGNAEWAKKTSTTATHRAVALANID